MRLNLGLMAECDCGGQDPTSCRSFNGLVLGYFIFTFSFFFFFFFFFFFVFFFFFFFVFIYYMVF